ncbi:MAG: FliA/WhiG family RNA polymerase sigma factor [Alphaproteobacteria bacterium]|nr:FliA/WhiG family RNA polymerase sigma factor [Alphaproteobacteria bacterium]
MNSYSKIVKPDINQLIHNHTNLVKKISWHLHGRVNAIVDIEDIIQLGMVGLINAAQNYVPQSDASFSSYASIRIKGEILDFLRKSSNLDRTTINIKKNAEKAINTLKNKLGREPFNHEVATELGISNEKYFEWSNAFEASITKSLDETYDDYSHWFVTKDMNPEEQINDTQLREQLKTTLGKLEGKEALVIQLYFVEELNIYEIAEVMDVSTGRVSQIKTSAIKKIRETLQKEI